MRELEALLDERTRAILVAASAAGAETGAVPWLVGGPVRDLLRHVAPGDLDFAVEGEASSFASDLATKLAGSLTRNERFLTWKLTTPQNQCIDLAGVRTETYPAQGALPVVAPAASIREDLGRRDFTVNAMAIRVDLGGLGVLADPFGGRNDLASGTLRILHGRSFIDDPTRLFRAIRLGLRCGLHHEPRTAALADEAIHGGALSSLTRERIWREIDLALDEVAPVPVLRAFAARGCLTTTLPCAQQASLARLPDRPTIAPGLDRRIVLIGALARGCDEQTLEQLPWGQATINAIRAIATREPSLGDALAGLPSVDDRYAACAAASGEERCLAALEVPSIASVVTQFERAVEKVGAIRGNELGVPPGPWIGRALRDTERALFRGEISESDASAFASRLAMRYLND